MAEVLKKKVEDKYNTESIKKSLKKKEEKNKKNVKTKKVEKKSSAKKGGLKEFWKSLVSEFKKIHWPSKKDMVKYSIATIFFIIFFAIFFYVIGVIFAFFRNLIF